MKKAEMAEKIKMSGLLIGCGILFFMLISCSSKIAQLTLDPREGEDMSQTYLIGPEDILEIVVWKNQALSKDVIVRPDGKISLPLIGDIQAAGQTAVQLKMDISEQLKPYYRESPVVSVIVRQVSSHIFILGEVQRPGRYEVKSGITVIQGIALAGGLTQFASSNKILLLRRENGDNRESAVKIQYKDIISGKNLETNFILKTGDTIIVH